MQMSYCDHGGYKIKIDSLHMGGACDEKLEHCVHVCVCVCLILNQGYVIIDRCCPI